MFGGGCSHNTTLHIRSILQAAFGLLQRALKRIMDWGGFLFNRHPERAMHENSWSYDCKQASFNWRRHNWDL